MFLRINVALVRIHAGAVLLWKSFERGPFKIYILYPAHPLPSCQMKINNKLAIANQIVKYPLQPLKVTSGIRHGHIGVPMLFLIYIKDLLKSSV